MRVILLLTIIGCALYGIQYYFKYEQARTEARDIKQQLIDFQVLRDSRSKDWTAYDTLKTKATQAAARTEQLEKQKEELEKKFRALEGEFKYMSGAARDAVEKVRTSTANTAIPEIKLTDGRILKDAKIRKIEVGQISFAHSDGIGSVPFNQLPYAILDQLDVGANSFVNEITTTENDIFTGITRAAGITLKSPLALTEIPYSMNVPAVAEVKRFEGKRPDELEISVAYFRYVAGTAVDLDAAAAGSLKSLSAMEGMTNPQQQARDIKISGYPAKRLSFSARRFGGEVSAESLILYNGEKMWVVQIVFTNKSKGAGPVAESILSSVQVDTGK